MRASLEVTSPCGEADDVSWDSATTCTENDDLVKIHCSSHSSTVMMNSCIDSSGRKRIPSLTNKNDSSRIRSRYLSRLGLRVPKVAPTSASKIQAIVTADAGTDERIWPKSVLKKNTTDPQKNCRVSFESSVSVHWIPHRMSYQDRASIWTPREELLESVERNALEFAADGWDWRTATEEKDFIFLHNQRLHPVHAPQLACNMQRQFLKVMFAQHCRG
eukprot:scaffold11212_cov121-Cylindrotheca_fusiformis.AAC.9